MEIAGMDLRHQSLLFLEKQYKNASISLERAKEKGNNAEEIVNLEVKIEVLEYLAGLVLVMERVESVCD